MSGIQLKLFRTPHLLYADDAIIFVGQILWRLTVCSILSWSLVTGQVKVWIWTNLYSTPVRLLPRHSNPPSFVLFWIWQNVTIIFYIWAIYSIWRTNLHPRHKLLLWKVLSNWLATMDRLVHLKIVQQATCFICECDGESVEHLFAKCPLICAILANSQWQLRANWLIPTTLVGFWRFLIPNLSSSQMVWIERSSFTS